MNNKVVYFSKVKPDAIIPTKREEDGCYDIYACFNENEIIIPAHTVKLIPTGIASAFPPDYRIAFRERGSNTKSTLQVMAGQIDSGYRGEFFTALYNGNDCPVTISKDFNDVTKTYKTESDELEEVFVPYKKAICQFAIEEVPKVIINEISYEDLQKFISERGIGKLGSSNK